MKWPSLLACLLFVAGCKTSFDTTLGVEASPKASVVETQTRSHHKQAGKSVVTIGGNCHRGLSADDHDCIPTPPNPPATIPGHPGFEWVPCQLQEDGLMRGHWKTIRDGDSTNNLNEWIDQGIVRKASPVS